MCNRSDVAAEPPRFRPLLFARLLATPRLPAPLRPRRSAPRWRPARAPRETRRRAPSAGDRRAPPGRARLPSRAATRYRRPTAGPGFARPPSRPPRWPPERISSRPRTLQQRRVRIPRSTRAGSVADELRRAALGEGDLDEVEVAWHDRVREERAGLFDDLMAEVPRREVREREKLHARLASDERRAAGGRVESLLRPLRLVGEECRLVDEEVGTACGLDDSLRGRGVGAQHDLATLPRRAEPVPRAPGATLGGSGWGAGGEGGGEPPLGTEGPPAGGHHWPRGPPGPAEGGPPPATSDE